MASRDGETFTRTVPDVNDIICEVHRLQVTDWHTLGVRLNLSVSKLRYIEASHSNLSRRLTEVISAWTENDEEYSWMKLGQALCEIPDHVELGKAILRKFAPEALQHQNYNVPVRLLSRAGGNPDSHISIGEQPLPTNYQLFETNSLHPPSHSPSLYPSSPSRSLYPPSPSPSLYPPSPSPSLQSRASSIASVSSAGQPIVIAPSGELATLPPNHPLLPPTYQPSVHQQPLPSFNQHLSLPPNNQHSSTLIPNNQYLSSIPPRIQQPPMHNSSSDTTASGQESFRKQHLARKEISRLEEKFTKLYMKVADIFVQERVDLAKVVRFIKFSLAGTIQYGWHFLQDHLESLEKSKNIEELLMYLLKFMSFDNYSLLEKLVKEFIQNEGEVLLNEYTTQYEEFIFCCPLAEYALAYTENRRCQGKQFWNGSPFQSNSVAVHFNSSWQQHTLYDVKQFQRRELSQYIPTMSMNMEHCEKRSIFIVWNTTDMVVKKLSIKCMTRFSHLKSQGVLQLFIGNLEIDFSSQRPEIYEYKQMNSSSLSSQALLKMAPFSLSLFSLHSDISSATQTSDSSKDSGYHSVSSDDEGVINYSFTDFSGKGISVQKGDIVKVLSVEEDMVHIKLENVEGHVPANAVHVTKQSQTPSLSRDRPVIVRTKTTQPEVVDDDIGTEEQTDRDELRPDTPPLEALVEAVGIILSESGNSVVMDPWGAEATLNLPAEKQIINYYPEVDLYQGKTSRKINFLKFLKSLRPKRQSITTVSVYSTVSQKRMEADVQSSRSFIVTNHDDDFMLPDDAFNSRPSAV